MNFLQDKPLHVRKRIVIVATGSIGIVLVLVMIYVYTRPPQPQRDPTVGIDTIYTTFITWVQMHLHLK
jgi:hypothetical protein